MSEGKFIVKGNYHGKDKCFPDLNNMISEACRFPKSYGKYKHEYEAIIINAIHLGLGRWKPQGRVRIDVICGEPLHTPKPRDEDNVIGAIRKMSHDALTRANIINDDDPSNVKCGYNKVIYTDDTPFFEVHIVEIDGGDSEVTN